MIQQALFQWEFQLLLAVVFLWLLPAIFFIFPLLVFSFVQLLLSFFALIFLWLWYPL
jgi:hypothetical protein